MKKETLIQKWLDNELNAEELEAFKQLEEADDYLKLSENAHNFKAPKFDETSNYARLQTQLKPNKNPVSTRALLKIAAVIAIAFGTYFAFFNTGETQVESLAGTTENLELPDGSNIVLNAVSSLRYDSENWEQNRKVHLTGEAFFQVAKGEQFEVVTDVGTISVLGTQFNVKQRPGYFEVRCFEGLVSVKTPEDSLLLPAGESFRIVKGAAEQSKVQAASPNWTEGVSSFQGVPFKQVIAELERQYQLEIHLKTRTFDTDQLFTGSFAHNNLETALKSVSVPFNLAYQLKDDIVILKVRDQ